MIFYVVNQKFNQDAYKAFFSELSTRLEYMSEDLNLETPDSHFDEMIEIITELRAQARSERVNKIMGNMPNNEVEF